MLFGKQSEIAELQNTTSPNRIGEMLTQFRNKYRQEFMTVVYALASFLGEDVCWPSLLYDEYSLCQTFD
jgi:hypothetical protein